MIQHMKLFVLLSYMYCIQQSSHYIKTNSIITQPTMILINSKFLLSINQKVIKLEEIALNKNMC